MNKLYISGGQRQKILLVRALAHQSKIILIDEGTSAIDQKATMAILREVTNTSATFLFIAHNFNVQMKQLFDREIHLTKLSELSKSPLSKLNQNSDHLLSLCKRWFFC